jgi:hypothetical protein
MGNEIGEIKAECVVATTEVDRNGNQMTPLSLNDIVNNTKLPIVVLENFVPEAQVGIVDRLWVVEGNGVTKLMANVVLAKEGIAVVPCYTVESDDMAMVDDVRVIHQARITQFGLTAMPADPNCCLKVYNGESFVDSNSMA